jgi:hypothetical protein
MNDDEGHEGQRVAMPPISAMLAAELEHDLATIRAVADQLDRTLPWRDEYATT